MRSGGGSRFAPPAPHRPASTRAWTGPPLAQDAGRLGPPGRRDDWRGSPARRPRSFVPPLPPDGRESPPPTHGVARCASSAASEKPGSTDGSPLTASANTRVTDRSPLRSQNHLRPITTPRRTPPMAARSPRSLARSPGALPATLSVPSRRACTTTSGTPAPRATAAAWTIDRRWPWTPASETSPTTCRVPASAIAGHSGLAAPAAVAEGGGRPGRAPTVRCGPGRWSGAPTSELPTWPSSMPTAGPLAASAAWPVRSMARNSVGSVSGRTPFPGPAGARPGAVDHDQGDPRSIGTVHDAGLRAVWIRNSAVAGS